MPNFVPGFTGWTAASLMPDKGLHDAAHNAIGSTFPDLPATPAAQPGTFGAVGGLTPASTLKGDTMPFNTPLPGYTPSSFATGSAPGLVDPTLASRPYTSSPAGSMNSVAQASAYNTPNVPGFLQNAVNTLNSNQSAQWSAQNDIINKIFGNIKTGSADESQWLDVLRAAVIKPGSAGYFGQAIQNPTLQAQQGNLFNEQAGNTRQQTALLAAQQKQQDYINSLYAKQAGGGSGWTSFGTSGNGGWTAPTF